MTGPYYGEVLTNLCQAVKEKRRGMLTRGPLLLHGNAPAHMSRVVIVAMLSKSWWWAIDYWKSCSNPMSQGHRVWTVVSPTLITRTVTQRLLPISTSEAGPSRNEVFRWWWAVTAHGVVSRQHAPGILFDRNKKKLFDKCQKCIDVQGDYINNNVIVLSVPFVHHTELQNVLIAPRT